MADLIVLRIDDRNVGRSLFLVARIGRWVVRILFAGLFIGFLLSEPQPPIPLALGVAAFGLGVLAVTEPLGRTDERIGALPAVGSVTLDDAGVRFHHESVLAEDGFVPWDGVSAVVVDQRKRWRFPYDVEGRRRFLFDNGWAGLDPSRRPPLLSTVPARPNLLFLLDPPVQLHWSHPNPTATSFIGFRGPGAGARPWATPALTPALWMAVVDPRPLKRSPQASARLRPLTKFDVHRLRYELGDLPGPNPYRRGDGDAAMPP